MSLTRINSANAFTGTIPAANFANATLDNVTSLPNAPLGDMVFISSATASASATIDFSLGNYKEYKFYFVNIHPQTDGVAFQFNFSTDGGSNYNVTKTTTNFGAFHYENDSSTNLGYDTGRDLAQSTSDQTFFSNGTIGNGADESTSGEIYLYNPSSTTFVKHFMSKVNYYNLADVSINSFVAGYANTTSALTNIRFQMSSGNIDEGKILMFGLN